MVIDVDIKVDHPDPYAAFSKVLKRPASELQEEGKARALIPSSPT
jgi:hypothetical protein